MTKREIQIALDNLYISVDTREHVNNEFKDRVNQLYQLCGGVDKNRPERIKLDYGDYSAKTVLADGTLLDLSTVVVIERKESLSEAIGNFTTHKERFEREFTRAKNSGANIHLIIENGSYTKLYSNKYENHPFVNGNSLRASFFALMCRYHITVHFCKPEQTPRLIYDIITHELCEYLEPKDASRYDEIRNRRNKKKEATN